MEEEQTADQKRITELEARIAKIDAIQAERRATFPADQDEKVLIRAELKKKFGDLAPF